MKAASQNADYKFRVETCFVPGHFPLYADDMGIVVVIDILRATSAMVTAFEHGVRSIIPVGTIEEARNYIGRDGYIAAAERNGEVVEGFAVGNSPIAFTHMDLAGKTIVMTTTNGTKAINLASGQRKVVIGSFLNLTALTDWLLEQNENVLLFCAGWKDKFNLEDSVFAGAVMERMLQSGKFGLEEDSSIAAKYLYMSARENMMGMLKAAPRRKRLESLNLYEDVKFCLTPDQSRVIPILRDGALVRMQSVAFTTKAQSMRTMSRRPGFLHVSMPLWSKIVAVLVVVSMAWPLFTREDAGAWGFFGHKRINRMACFTLPPQMFGFYKRHIDFISDHAVDPDRRRYSNPDEAPRHYIDIDHYAVGGNDPFTEVPREWKLAVAKYTEDTLKAYGIVPWHIQVVYNRLVKAFERGDVDRILYYSADLGHYVADSHVPLHTTENYNGQMTNQVGIHAFWESRIPELSAESDYDHLVGRAVYIDDPLATAWEAVHASHMAVDSVLSIERALNERYPADQKYVFEDRGRGTLRFPSQEFTRAYEDAMGGMVERRMNAAIITLGSFWYSAWVNAGQPDLDRFEQKDVSDSLKQILAAEEEALKMARESMGHEEPNE